jgi:UDP-3-O-[3-hydroxymyristoyl] glucosamine N-acyltransferase
VNGSLAISESVVVGSNVSIGRELSVNGSVGVSSDANFLRTVSIGATLTVLSDTDIGNQLTVGGSTGIGSDLTVGGGTTIAYNLTVGGNSDISGNTVIGGSVSIGTTVGISSNTDIGGSVGIAYTLGVGSNVEIGGTLDVEQYVQLNDGLTVVRSAGVGQSLTVDGFVGFASDLVVAKSIEAKAGILSAINVVGISTFETAFISGLSYPTLDGQPGQALVTDGAGNITFGAGGSSSESRIKVSANEGSDLNDGRILPVATIKKALQLASRRLKNTTPSRFIDAANLISLNKDFIKSEVVAYLEQTYPALLSNPDYDATVCARDVGYIVDALVHDLKYGGNSKVVNAGLKYWDGAVNAVAGEVTETVAGFNHIVTISQYIINNIAVPIPYQGLYSQEFDTNVPYDASVSRDAYDLNSCANVYSAIGTYINIINTIIQNGPEFAPNKSYPQPEFLDAVKINASLGKTNGELWK